jgi:hypothetical protein
MPPTGQFPNEGAHVRADHEDLNPNLKVNFVVSKDPDGSLSVASEPVPPVPEGLKAWAEGEELEVAGRLLE